VQRNLTFARLGSERQSSKKIAKPKSLKIQTTWMVCRVRRGLLRQRESLSGYDRDLTLLNLLQPAGACAIDCSPMLVIM
jgi:hypothetical protein